MHLGLLTEIKNYCADPEAVNFIPNLLGRACYNLKPEHLTGIKLKDVVLLGSFGESLGYQKFDVTCEGKQLYFDSYPALEEFVANFNSLEPKLFCLHLALEAAANPLILLGTLKDFLTKSPESQIFYLYNPQVSPETVYRTWGVEQIKSFFKLQGLKTEELELGLLVSYEPSYEELVAKEVFGFEFSPSKINTLILTTEYAPAHQAGGIGTFFHNRYLMNPEETAILYLRNSELAASLKIITPDHFGYSDLTEIPTDYDLALAFVRILGSFFSHLKFVHYHDYSGIGFRVAQAAKTRDLPARINTIVSLNGNHQYVENASGVWSFFIDELEVVREKISTELADLVIAPTKFIADLTVKNGFNLDSTKIQVLRHPFIFTPLVNEPRRAIRRLVFFGKRVWMKGYPDFLSVAKRLVIAHPAIKEVVFIGTPSDICTEQLSELKALVSVIEYELSSRDAKNLLAFFAPESLILFPNSQENFGNVILEAVSMEIPFVCYLSGGSAEVLLPEFHDDFGAKPNQAALYQQAEKLLTLSPEVLAEKIVAMKSCYLEMQSEINQTWSNISSTLPVKSPPKIKFDSKDVTLMIPVYETDLKYLQQLFCSLKLLVFKPSQVIIVDDCSRGNYHQKLQELCKKEIELPYHLIKNSENLGCPATRNVALEYCRTKYLANIDSDDLPYPNFLLSLYQALEADSLTGASMGFYPQLAIEEDLNVKNITGHFCPYGDGIVANLRRNYLGIAMSMVNTKIVKELGGWTGNHLESGDDFRLFVKILQKNLRISVIPALNGVYRIRSNSFSRRTRTYNENLLTAKEMNTLPIFERIRFHSVVQSAWNFHGEYLGAIKKIHNLYDQFDLQKQELERAQERIRESELKQ